MELDFEMDDVPLAQLRDDGLSANECYPKELIDDPTFALLNTDNYFRRNKGSGPRDWSQAPSAQLINGRSPPYGKRGLEFQREQFAWDDGNSSRPFTDDEAEAIADLPWWEEDEAKKQDALGYVPCLGDDCATEITRIARYVTPLHHQHQLPVTILQSLTFLRVNRETIIPVPRTAPSVAQAIATPEVAVPEEVPVSAGSASSRPWLKQPAAPMVTGLS